MAANTGTKTIKYKCCKCGNESAEKNHFRSHSELYSDTGHLPICKDCLVLEYKKYKIMYGSSQRAMQRLCMAFDIYFNADVFDLCDIDDNTAVGKYMRHMNLGQHKGKTFDCTIDDGFYFTGEKSSIELEKREEDHADMIDPALIRKWGEGLPSPLDYNTLEDHYKYLKSANPNCDSNQEIFITDLCYTKMQQMRAVREGRVDDYNKLTESYRKTFTQAGLKTVQDTSMNSDDCWGIWQERISQYTPEEYYKNKKLYKDFDGLGDYFERFVLRPLRNLMFGTQDRDAEFCVKDEDDNGDYAE